MAEAEKTLSTKVVQKRNPGMLHRQRDETGTVNKEGRRTEGDCLTVRVLKGEESEHGVWGILKEIERTDEQDIKPSKPSKSQAE